MTQRVDLDLTGMDLDVLIDDEAVDEVFDGAQVLQDDGYTPHPEVETETPNIGVAGEYTVKEDQVLLVNVRYPQQRFALYSGGKYVGQFAQFMDGILVTDRSTADDILSRPGTRHVYEEPREGYVFEHKPTKFKTRNPEAYEEYVRVYHENL